MGYHQKKHFKFRLPVPGDIDAKKTTFLSLHTSHYTLLHITSQKPYKLHIIFFLNTSL